MDEQIAVENGGEVELCGVMQAITFADKHWTSLTSREPCDIVFTDNDKRLYLTFRLHCAYSCSHLHSIVSFLFIDISILLFLTHDTTSFFEIYSAKFINSFTHVWLTDVYRKYVSCSACTFTYHVQHINVDV